VQIDIVTNDNGRQIENHMGYRMAYLPMTLSEFEGHFCCPKPLYWLYLINIAQYNYDMFIHKLESACGL